MITTELELQARVLAKLLKFRGTQRGQLILMEHLKTAATMKYLIIYDQRIYQSNRINEHAQELASTGKITIINLESGMYFPNGLDGKELETWGAVTA